MKTVLNKGDWITYRYKGEMTFAKIEVWPTLYVLGPERPKIGDKVYLIVWKKEKMVVKKERIIK